jgi:hypothetical protein
VRGLRGAVSMYSSKIGEQNTDTVIGTYQEGLLSRRRLIFGQSQVAFQCLKTCTCEAIPIDLRVPQDYGNSAYSSRKIKDTIQSLSGLLEVRGAPAFAKKNTRKRLVQREVSRLEDQRIPQEVLVVRVRYTQRFHGVLRYAWLLSIPTYHFWGVPFDGPLHPIMDNHHDGAFLAAPFWGPEKYADAKRPHHSHVTRRESFPSWTWAGWRGLSAIAMPRARRLEGTVSLRDLNDAPLRLRDYIVIVRQSWNIYDFKPLLYVTGWFAMIRVELHKKGTRWVAVGTNDGTDRSTATVPFADVNFVASPPESSIGLDLGNLVAVPKMWPASPFLLPALYNL